MKTRYKVAIYGFMCEVWNQTEFTEEELIEMPFDFDKGMNYGSSSAGEYGTFDDEAEARAAYESAKVHVNRAYCEQTHVKGLYSVSFDILQLGKYTVDEDDEEDNFEVIAEYAEGNI